MVNGDEVVVAVGSVMVVADDKKSNISGAGAGVSAVAVDADVGGGGAATSAV